MSLDAIQQKKQVIESRSRIREFVFGIQDGLISTVGLLAGIQGATENNLVVIVTGLTAMFSGAISMATGSYLRPARRKIFSTKNSPMPRSSPTSEPYIAAEGLLKALGEEGLSKEQSYRMVKVLLLERNVFSAHFSRKSFRSGQRRDQSAAQGRVRDGTVIHHRRGHSDLSLYGHGRCDGALLIGALKRLDAVCRRGVQRPPCRPVAVRLRRQIFRHRRQRGRVGILDRSRRAVFLSGISIPA